MTGLAMIEMKDDHDPLPTREQHIMREAAARARCRQEHKFNQLMQVPVVPSIASVAMESLMVELKDAFARLDQQKEPPR